MAEVTFGYPLNTLHIRLQQPPLSLMPASSNAFALARRPLSAIDLLLSIVALEGPTTLYHSMERVFIFHCGMERLICFLRMVIWRTRMNLQRSKKHAILCWSLMVKAKLVSYSQN